ncbi:hypothetical protein GCM10010385_67580 [Streptomyces geysiriensis]|nr:hypothetical protein GCM10010385_67580 [Streptomyces geysiriensis]GHC38175.1 hypothetical protein GCM10010308_66080 [Streptomyces vinaceusdrappus]
MCAVAGAVRERSREGRKLATRNRLPFVHAGWMRSAAQGESEVAPGFSEQMVAREGAAQHEDHGDGVHGGHGNIDNRPARACCASP